MRFNGFLGVLTLCTTVFVAGCLPEENKTNTSSAAGDVTTAQAKMDYVAQSLSSYALRSQYELAKSNDWRKGTVPEGKISMSGVDMGGAGKIATSAFCRDTGSGGYHLTWAKDSSAGGQMMTALSRRVASDSLGMVKEGGKIATQAGKEIALSAACKTSISASLKSGAPVIVMALSMPSNTDMAGQTKVLFETVACDGVREKGYKMVKVVTKYNAAGNVMAGYPRRTDESSSCTETSIADANAQSKEGSILSNAGGFGSSGIANLLKDNLGQSNVACTEAKQEIVTGYDKKGNPITKVISVADSCNATNVKTDQIDSIKEDDAEGDKWEKNDEVGYCQNGAGSKTNVDLFGATGGVWTWGDWKGKYYSKRWNDYRTVSVSRGDERVTETQIIRGPWIGDYAECYRNETYVADCRTIPAVLEFGVPYVSNSPIEVLNGMDSRSFRTQWAVSWIRGWLGCVFGCTKVIKYDVTILDENYYRGLEVEGNVHLDRKLDITTFDNPEKFKLSKPIENPWVYNKDKATCSVNKREALFGCTSENVTDTGSTPGFGGWKTINYGPDIDSYDNDLQGHLTGQRWVFDSNEVDADGNNLFTYKRSVDFIEPADIEILYNYPRTADGAVLTSFNYGYDSNYLLSKDDQGKLAYVSDYVVRIDLGKKKKSLFSSKTTRDSYAVDRVYIDADKKGYQIIRKQGYYYVSRKLDFDGTKFFLTDDTSNTSNVPTQCLSRRFKGGTVAKDYSYNYTYECGSGDNQQTCTGTVTRKFWMYPVDFHTYVGVTPEKGRKTATNTSNLCVTEKTTNSDNFGNYFWYAAGDTEKHFWRCDTAPSTCAEQGMKEYTYKACIKTGMGWDWSCNGGDGGWCSHCTQYEDRKTCR